MHEGPPKPEAAPEEPGVDLFEGLVAKGEWGEETERALDELLEKHEEDLYMLYLNYRESGLADDLSPHERRMYEWLAEVFGHLP
ncbi:MAG: hypothetical protein KGI78_04580 [Patescibacteria group bacterium]|nr:hypothetical protein [Patescibacteria group bacterium]MDE1944254.1 hypothetical protein [Patescibacteria group bacterium]MDE1945226.1 hypothetical protein [Patescibacteria group bacterium]MDE2058085.1 hypothetical protein [Patescibacteria group bacterium]